MAWCPSRCQVASVAAQRRTEVPTVTSGSRGDGHALLSQGSVVMASLLCHTAARTVDARVLSHSASRLHPRPAGLTPQRGVVHPVKGNRVVGIQHGHLQLGQRRGLG